MLGTKEIADISEQRYDIENQEEPSTK